MVCDFCTSPNVKWNFPAEDCEVLCIKKDGDEYHEMSRGGWASCDICHALIVAKDREGLLNRSVEMFKKLNRPLLPGEESGFIRPLLMAVHNAFWNAMTGEYKKHEEVYYG